MKKRYDISVEELPEAAYPRFLRLVIGEELPGRIVPVLPYIRVDIPEFVSGKTAARLVEVLAGMLKSDKTMCWPYYRQEKR